METVLTILKFAGLVFGTTLGVLGTVTKTHDEINVQPLIIGAPERTERHLNRWGKISLTLMLIGFVVALTAQIFEEIEKSRAKEESARATLEQLHRAQITLQGVERLLLRMNEIGVTAYFTFPIDDPAVSPDLDWLAKLPNVKPDRGGDIPGFQGVVPGSLEGTEPELKVSEALVYCDSPFHPYYHGKTPLKEFLHLLSLSVAIYKPNSTNATGASPYVETKPGENLAWRSRTVPVCSRFQAHVDRRSAAGMMVTASMRKPPEYADGRVTSLRDLPGCEIVVYPILFDWRMPSEASDVVDRLLRATKVSPGGLLLEIDGFTFDLSKFPQRKTWAGLGAGGYCFKLPPTIEELMNSAKGTRRPTF